jgi:hypothetical protein
MSMGVYLSEINMPKGDGSKLVLQIFPNGEVYDGHGIRLGITNWAEAVPVPPHGRLVDMDEIEERIDSCCDDIDCSKTMCNECAVQIVMNKVFDAPTIIPAEEE